MSDKTARNALPMLAVGQAAKEITHNEALAIIDGLLQPAAEAEQPSPPVSLSQTDAGRCWIVGQAASGEWAGQDGNVAYWTGASWRFITFVSGSPIYRSDSQVMSAKLANGWHVPAAIPAPQGGSVIDAESRAAIASILSELKTRGLLPT